MPRGYLKHNPIVSRKVRRGGGSHSRSFKETSSRPKRKGYPRYRHQKHLSYYTEQHHEFLSHGRGRRIRARGCSRTQFNSKQLGENLCPEYTDTGLASYILAISQLVRGGDPKPLVAGILSKGSPKEIADLFVLMFATRNARGGKGEKMLAFHIFLHLRQAYPQTAVACLPLFAHYGYWKDLLLISEMAHKEAQHPRFVEAGESHRCNQSPDHTDRDRLAQLQRKLNCDVIYAAVAIPPEHANTGELTKTQLEAEKILDECITVMKSQLKKDLAAVDAYNSRLSAAENEKEAEAIRKGGPEISLLAKWLPREGKHFDKTIGFVKAFTSSMWPLRAALPSTSGDAWKAVNKSKYRKAVSKLTSFLELPEVLLAAQRADEINFHKLASKATLRLTKTFLNEDKEGKQRSHDPKRIRLRELFVNHMVEKGLKGGQVSPHEIVREILSKKGSISKARELVLDTQWKDLWKSVVEEVKAKAKEEGLAFNPAQMVPLSDVSGSMCGVPMEVSIALGIGVSEITHPAFRNMVMTFESTPRWHRLNERDTIVKKVLSLSRAPWGGSTNFEAAFDLILRVCTAHRLSYADMPSLIVFSDMQFDQAAGVGGYRYRARGDKEKCPTPLDTMFDHMKVKLATAATRLGWSETDLKPIVFWNLRNTGGHPVNKNTEGTVLLAGFSPSLLKMVMNGEALREEEVEVVKEDGTTVTEKIRVTPEQTLRKMLDDSLYDPVREILSASKEGIFLEASNNAKDEAEPMTVGIGEEEGFELIEDAS